MKRLTEKQILKIITSGTKEQKDELIAAVNYGQQMRERMRQRVPVTRDWKKCQCGTSFNPNYHQTCPHCGL